MTSAADAGCLMRVVMGCRGCGCVLCWLREGLCLMLVAAGMVRLLFTGQLAGGHLSILEFLVARGADVHAQDK